MRCSVRLILAHLYSSFCENGPEKDDPAPISGFKGIEMILENELLGSYLRITKLGEEIEFIHQLKIIETNSIFPSLTTE